uniref:SLC26A/SulP transporter domain-containing protein n=1 Tax=Panagrolaimus superbus TaxID=310955 RepID=A0A914XX89_9BILA
MANPAPPTTPPINQNNNNNNIINPKLNPVNNVSMPEVTAESSSLASLGTHTDTLSSAKAPITQKIQKVLNVNAIMEEKTQSIENNVTAIAKLQQIQPENNDIKDAAIAAILKGMPTKNGGGGGGGVQLVSDGTTHVYSEKVINQEEFDKKHGFRRVNLSLLRVLEGHYHQILKWNLPQWGGFFKSRIPIVEWLPSYDFRNDIISDITGGLMVSIMSIPQGLAYGFLVGLPPIFGLYSSIIGPLVYAVLGTSKHASPGAFAILALMVGSAVEQLRNDPNDFVPSEMNETAEFLCCSENKSIPLNIDGPDPEVLGIVSCVTFMTGIIQVCDTFFKILNVIFD